MCLKAPEPSQRRTTSWPPAAPSSPRSAALAASGLGSGRPGYMGLAMPGVLAEPPRTLSSRAQRAPAGPAPRRPVGRGRRCTGVRVCLWREPGLYIAARPAGGAGGGGSRRRLARAPLPRRPARAAFREARERGRGGARRAPETALQRGARARARGGGARGGGEAGRGRGRGGGGDGAAGARGGSAGRGTLATLDSASPAAGVAAPPAMVSGRRAPPASAAAAPSSSPPPTRRAGRGPSGRRRRRGGLRVRPLEPVAVGGPGRAGLGRGRRTFAGGGRAGRARAPVSPAPRSCPAPPGAGRRVQPPVACTCPPRRPPRLAAAAPRSRSGPARWTAPLFARDRPRRGTHAGSGALTVEFPPARSLQEPGVCLRAASPGLHGGVGVGCPRVNRGERASLLHSLPPPSAPPRNRCLRRLRLISRFMRLSAGS